MSTIKGSFTNFYSLFSPTINSVRALFLHMCCHHFCVDLLTLFHGCNSGFLGFYRMIQCDDNVTLTH